MRVQGSSDDGGALFSSKDAGPGFVQIMVGPFFLDDAGQGFVQMMEGPFFLQMMPGRFLFR